MAKHPGDGSIPALDDMDDAELLAHLVRALRSPPPDSVLDAYERAIDGPPVH